MPTNVDFPNWIAALTSIIALILSLLSLMKTINQRRPYLSVSFDGQKGRFCLTNYGRVPAILNKIEFPSDLDRLKETDNFASYLFGEESRKPFEDLEGTVIGPNLSYHFYAETSVDILKKNPYITIILEYCAANRFSLRK